MEQTEMQLKAVNAALAAGRSILEVYHSPEADWQVEHKADDSPLTLADRRANRVIADALQSTGLPVLSEETQLADYAERRHWRQLWIVDPLDGTKEFIKRNGEFTVNIALVHEGAPVFGVVYVPAQERLYVGLCGQGSVRLGMAPGEVLGSMSEVWRRGECLPLASESQAADPVVRVVVSRSHLDERTQQYIRSLEARGHKVETVASGSSIKICLLAERTAHLYPRFAPTSEWDTAAGHAVLAATGGRLCQAESGEPLIYNKENILNPYFMGCAAGCAAFVS